MGTRTAALFDLDRTLVTGASGPVFARALRAAGLAGAPIPGEQLLFGMFNALGENLASMVLARQAVTLAKGRSADAVRAAASDAVDELVTMIAPFAWQVIDDHRAKGHVLALATTTPHDLVTPLAQRLGFDAVVATRYRVAADGTYDGALDGPFVWSAGKLTAVQRWAAEADVNLSSSWAYSDSFYDAPMLSAVGNPVAVNPDPRLAVLATTRRWPVRHFDVPDGVAKVPVVGLEVQRLLLTLARPEFFPYARFDIDGIHHLPADGPVLVCANHRSYFDVAAMAVMFARAGRPVRFLGKKEVFDAPIIGALASALGGIRVDRGTGSDVPLDAARAALDAGEVVAIMPQGTIPRGRAFFDPDLQGRWGAARLAAQANVPVVPVGLWGTERVWPRSSRVPQVWNVMAPPTVRVRVGEPIRLDSDDPDTDTRRLMTAIKGLLPDEAQQWREPTADEVATTVPPGAGETTGDVERERRRRPGTD
jgi:putative phosphoserine phosphatase / 1-acylglycerol-3-phosphate O-acyltransferase